MAEKLVLSGIRPTNKLHLGNYLGAVKGMVELQNRPNYNTFYMVADYHMLTTHIDTKDLQKQVEQSVIDYLSCGLDPKKSVIFIQSQISEHTELSYILSALATVARMLHLPTYKDKVKENPKNVSMALLNYPVLMASDILLYNANFVPVGKDQQPHIEVARELAKKLNNKYKTKITIPKNFNTEGALVPSLNTSGKMSKSVKGSAIFLTDNLKQIKEKLAKVPTDSGVGKEVPKDGGVYTLLKLVELFDGRSAKLQYQKAYKGEGIKYKDLKNELAESIYKTLKPIQKERAKIENNPIYVKNVLIDGNKRAKKVASDNLHQIKSKMGLDYKKLLNK